MTKERIAEVEKIIKWQRKPYPNEPHRKIVSVTKYTEIVPELLAEVKRLQAALAAK